jgi:hypothetical protein
MGRACGDLDSGRGIGVRAIVRLAEPSRGLAQLSERARETHAVRRSDVAEGDGAGGWGGGDHLDEARKCSCESAARW